MDVLAVLQQQGVAHIHEHSPLAAVLCGHHFWVQVYRSQALNLPGVMQTQQTVVKLKPAWSLEASWLGLKSSAFARDNTLASARRMPLPE